VKKEKTVARTDKRKNLTNGSIIKNVWYLAVPLMVGYVLRDTFNIVDMVFVGKLGPTAIAAVAMAGFILGLVYVAAMGIGTGTVAMVARFVGNKNFEKAEQVTIQSLFMAIIYSAGIALVGWVLAEPLLGLLGAESEVIRLGASYLKIVFIGSFTIFIFILLAFSLRAAGDAVTPTKALALATFLNIGLDPLLIFGIWIFPRMGVAGSALATIISQGAGMVYLMWVFFAKKSVIHLSLRNLKVDFNIMGRIVKIGVFGSLEMLARNLSGLVIVRFVAIYGTFTVAAYGIGMRLMMVAMMPGFGIAQAAAALVGQNLGAEKPDRAAKSAWFAAGFYGVIMAGIATIYILFSHLLIGLFNTDPRVIRVGEEFLNLVSFGFVFMALSIVLARAMQGAGDTITPMVITGICLFALRIPLIILFSQQMSLATRGLWMGIVVSSVVQGSIVTFWFSRGRWKYKRI